MDHGALTHDDVQFLNGLGLPWRLVRGALKPNEIPIQHGDVLIIENIKLPARLQPSQAGMLLVVQAYYPATPLDMFYLDKQVTRADKRQIPSVIQVQILGTIWWRWSRHRAPGSWRPGVDGIATHYQLIREVLEKDAA